MSSINQTNPSVETPIREAIAALEGVRNAHYAHWPNSDLSDFNIALEKLRRFKADPESVNELRDAILFAKSQFQSFFGYMNAGEAKSAGMCILDAETALTKALLTAQIQPKRVATCPAMSIPAAPIQSSEKLESQVTELIKDRDNLQEVLDTILNLVLGEDRPEWSSAYRYRDAIVDVEEAMSKPTQTREAALSQQIDWSQAGRLMDASMQAKHAGFLVGTSNWAAHVFKAMQGPGASNPVQDRAIGWVYRHRDTGKERIVMRNEVASLSEDWISVGGLCFEPLDSAANLGG